MTTRVRSDRGQLHTDHTLLDRERLLREATLVVDTRDALRDVVGDRSKVYGL
jgi:hypothetical protein